MIKQLLTLAALTFSLSASAQTHPLWMRYSAISPDGSTIAFSYKGDIYTVPVGGGNARQLTSNAAYDAYPVWSPDGQNIAFASTREGSMDIYLMNRNGGAPKRLTTDSGDEYPQTFRDNTHILFSANGMPTQKSIIFAGGSFPQVYEVGTNGGRPRLFSGLTMLNISINQRGDILYHDQKGYEDPYRKHHQSPITRDIWLLKNGRYTRLTTFKGEDRNPVWAPDGTHLYYLSETDGTFNVYKRSADGAETTQLTHFKGNPVRFLTVSNNGTLCFGYDGEIYTLRDGGQPQRVNVSVVADRSDTELQRRNWTYGASEIKVSPTGKEIAFVLHGDVYVTSVDYKTTKQITDTPEQERNIDFSPDGKSLVYASERGGLWQIYMAKPKNSNEKNFTYATDIIEEQLVKSAKTSQMPQFSPDGKSVAFFEDRGDLRVIDIKTKAVHTAMDGKYIYSYSDGDIWFEWSPDSKWLLSAYIGNGGGDNTRPNPMPGNPDPAIISPPARETPGSNNAAKPPVSPGVGSIAAASSPGNNNHGCSATSKPPRRRHVNNPAVNNPARVPPTPAIGRQARLAPQRQVVPIRRLPRLPRPAPGGAPPVRLGIRPIASRPNSHRNAPNVPSAPGSQPSAGLQPPTNPRVVGPLPRAMGPEAVDRIDKTHGRIITIHKNPRVAPHPSPGCAAAGHSTMTYIADTSNRRFVLSFKRT